MLKVGLTGGIGCGKSTAVEQFRAYGVPIIDADKLARSLMEAGQPALQKVVSFFGTSFLLEDGSLNRHLLKEEIFKHPESRLKLEAIIHPLVREAIIKQLNQLLDADYVVVDIPLLVEKGYCSLFDRIVVVDCLPQQQLERVSLRDQLDEKILQSIIKTQASRENRLKMATDVLDNTGNIDLLTKQLVDLHHKLIKCSALLQD